MIAEAIFLYFILLTSFEQNHNFSNKNDHLPTWRKMGNNHFTICTNGPVRAKNLPRFQFEGKTDL